MRVMFLDIKVRLSTNDFYHYLKDSEDVGHSWAKLELEDGKTVHSRLVVHLF